MQQARKYDANSVGKQSDGEKRSTKNRHLMIVNQLRKREDEWNNRFYIENIPEYHFTSDKHCETYKQLILEKARIGKRSPTREGVNAPSRSDDKVIFAPGKIRKKTAEQSPMYLYAEGHSGRPESNEPVNKIGISQGRPPQYQIREKTREGQARPRSMNKRAYIPENYGADHYEEEIKNLEAEITGLWETHNVPQFHRDLFLKSLGAGKPKTVMEIYRREIDELNQNHAVIQNASKAVLARENCLKQLRETTKNIAEAENSEEGDLEEVVGRASELLTHLRILSLNAVECIVKWREFIQNIYYISRGVVKPTQPASIPFWFYGTNYLLKMKNDTKDFVATSLAKYFNFSSKSDPFLVYPSKEIDEGEGSQKTILYISKALINRIRASELVILEESVHEHLTEKRVHDSQNSLDTHLRSPADSDAKRTSQYRSPGVFDSNKGKVNQQPKTKETSALRRKFSFKNERENFEADGNNAGLRVPDEDRKEEFSPSHSEYSDKKENPKAFNPEYEGIFDTRNAQRAVSGGEGKAAGRMDHSAKKVEQKRPNIPIAGNQRVPVRKDAEKQPANRLNADRVPIRATPLRQNEREIGRNVQNDGKGEKIPTRETLENPSIKDVEKPVQNEPAQKQIEKLPPKEQQEKKVTKEPIIHEPKKEPTNEAKKEPIGEQPKEGTEEPRKEAIKEQPKETVKEQLKESPKEPIKEPVKEQEKELAEEQYQEDFEEPIKEIVEDEINEPKKEVVKEQPKEEIIEPLKETIKEPIKETIKDQANKPEEEAVKEQPKEVEKEQPKESPKKLIKEPSNEQVTEIEKPVEKKPEPKAEEKPTEQQQDAGSSELTLVPLEAFETEIGDIFSNHNEHVEDILRRSFNSSITDILNISNSGQDARWIEIKRGGQHLGLAAANINSSNYTVRRLQLLYFTVTDLSLHEAALTLLLDYFWKKDPCDDIWVGLFHMEDETGRLGVNKKVEEAYKKNGFRWKRITNDSDSGTRKTEYAAKRPEGVVSEAKLNEEIFIKEAITLSDKALTKVPKPSGMYVDNRFCTVSALLNHCDERLTKFSDDPLVTGYLNLIGEAQGSNPEGWLKYGVVFEKKSNISEVKELMHSKLESNDFLPTTSEQEGNFSCCLMSLIYRWQSFNVGTLPIKGKKVSCLRINKSGNEMISMNSRYCNSKVYLLPTDDSNVNIFITDNAELVEKIQTEKESFQTVISSLFKKLGRDQDPVNQDIWLPCFELNAENQELPEVPNAFKDEYKVVNGVATYKIQVGAKKACEGVLKIVPDEEAITFNKSFVFGVTHSKLDVPLFALLVKEDYFLASS